MNLTGLAVVVVLACIAVAGALAGFDRDVPEFIPLVAMAAIGGAAGQATPKRAPYRSSDRPPGH